MIDKEKKNSEKEVEKIFREQDPYAGAVLEEVREQLAIVIEGNNVLEHKIDRVDAKLETFRAEANEKFEAYSEDMKSLRDHKAEKSDVTLIEHRVVLLENL